MLPWAGAGLSRDPRNLSWDLDTRRVSVERSELVQLTGQIPDVEVAGAVADFAPPSVPVGERFSWPPAWVGIGAALAECHSPIEQGLFGNELTTR